MTHSEERAAVDLREWSPQWVAARSLSVSQSVLGNPEPLHRFIDDRLGHPNNQLAHLRYWAYWVGEIPALWVADEQMTTPDQVKWDGETMTQSFIRNHDPAVPYRDADRLECLLQTQEYQREGYREVQPWVDTMAQAVSTRTGKRLAQEGQEMPPGEWWKATVASYGLPTAVGE